MVRHRRCNSLGSADGRTMKLPLRSERPRRASTVRAAAQALSRVSQAARATSSERSSERHGKGGKAAAGTLSKVAHRCRLVSFLSCASLAMLARHFFQESKRSRVPPRSANANAMRRQDRTRRVCSDLMIASCILPRC